MEKEVQQPPDGGWGEDLISAVWRPTTPRDPVRDRRGYPITVIDDPASLDAAVESLQALENPPQRSQEPSPRTAPRSRATDILFNPFPDTQ